ATIFILAVELTRPPAAASLLRRRPWAMAALFGLLHGLSFAGALLEIGLPQGDVPLALAAFNVGIEAGQVAFVAVVLAAAAAVRGGLVRAVRIERIHAVRLAVARAPAAGRILEHAHVPEGRLSGVERRVGPQRAERRRAAPGGRARARLDGRAVVATSGDVVDRLVRRAAGVDPSLDDLDGLKVTAGGILQDRHREARRARLAGLREKAAHRHPARVTLL